MSCPNFYRGTMNKVITKLEKFCLIIMVNSFKLKIKCCVWVSGLNWHENRYGGQLDFYIFSNFLNFKISSFNHERKKSFIFKTKTSYFRNMEYDGRHTNKFEGHLQINFCGCWILWWCCLSLRSGITMNNEAKIKLNTIL